MGAVCARVCLVYTALDHKEVRSFGEGSEVVGCKIMAYFVMIVCKTRNMGWNGTERDESLRFQTYITQDVLPFVSANFSGLFLGTVERKEQESICCTDVCFM